MSYLVNEDPSEPEIKGILERINFNYHWKKYHELCQPCAIDYDVIAHLETIEEDSRLEAESSARFLFPIVVAFLHFDLFVGICFS